ncbi:GPO family capsid scaffolding protein [Neisseria sp. S1]|uniref:GPO family capsid scaffolding protein n=1 Tax=Neisseria sp. S1 TaxID=3318354 RepID=UPI003A89C284
MSKGKSDKKITEWRLVALSGKTADGRTIPAEHIREMAESYNPETLGARINLEHLHFLLPNPEFAGLGDVVALKAEKQGDKVALYAKLAVNPALQKMWDSDQKIYSSIEYVEQFADTGKAYLVGLAVTDTPASLNTSRHFSVSAVSEAEKSVKLSEYTEMSEKTKKQGLFAALFASLNATSETETKDTDAENKDAPSQVANPDVGDKKEYAEKSDLEEVKAELEAAAKFGAEMVEKFKDLQDKFEKFKAEVESAPVSGERKPHSGSGNESINW